MERAQYCLVACLMLAWVHCGDDSGGSQSEDPSDADAVATDLTSRPEFGRARDLPPEPREDVLTDVLVDSAVEPDVSTEADGVTDEPLEPDVIRVPDESTDALPDLSPDVVTDPGTATDAVDAEAGDLRDSGLLDVVIECPDTVEAPDTLSDAEASPDADADTDSPWLEVTVEHILGRWSHEFSVEGMTIRVELDLRDEGVCGISNPDEPFFDPVCRWRLEGERLVVQDEGCGLSREGSYTVVSLTPLSFTLVFAADTCPQRQEAVIGLWTRVE